MNFLQNRFWSFVLFLFAFVVLPVLLLAGDQSVPENIFLIKAIDTLTGRGIPLVELEAFNALNYQSDNLGNIAIIEPDLSGKVVRFLVRGNGYRVPQLDFFGERSFTVKIVPGTAVTLQLERTAPAERLYRITGSGRYRDSMIAGIDCSEYNCELSGKVFGLDSAVPAVWQNRLLSFYGDTLGPANINLSGSGAEIDLSRPGVPDRRLPLQFFVDEDGFARKMVVLPETGFVWIETAVPLLVGKNNNKTVLGMRYVLHKTLEKAVETGYAVFDIARGRFIPVKRVKSDRQHKSARATPVKYNGDSGFCLQPWERVANRLSAFIKPEEYEYYSCLRETALASISVDACRIDGRNFVVERDKSGKPLMRWRKNTLPYNAIVQRQLLQQGCIEADEVWLRLAELGSGKRLRDFTGSISYNKFRERWVMFVQGDTGEIWYSEADTYTGPWLYAKKIISHDDYNFYNPVHHAWFDKGSKVYLEGTYTSFFTEKERKTPRTDYNQVLYRLDLADHRLAIPRPVYRVKHGKDGYRLWTAELVDRADRWKDVEKVEFFAFEKDFGKPWLQPVYDHSAGEDRQPSLLPEEAGGDLPVFYTIVDPAGTVELPADCDINLQFTETGRFPGRVLRADLALLSFDPQILPDLTTYKISASLR